MEEGEMSYKQTKHLKLIEEFISRGYPICRIDFDKDMYKKTNTFATCLQSAAKRFGRTHIRAIVYKDNVYLINKLKG